MNGHRAIPKASRAHSGLPDAVLWLAYTASSAPGGVMLTGPNSAQGDVKINLQNVYT